MCVVADSMFGWSAADLCEGVCGLSLCNQATDDVAALADACRHRTYLPNPVLASSLPWVRKRMEQRRKLYALVPEKKRRILIKLLALRSWIGDRVFEKTTAEGMVPLSRGRRDGGCLHVAGPFRSNRVAVLGVEQMTLMAFKRWRSCRPGLAPSFWRPRLALTASPT